LRSPHNRTRSIALMRALNASIGWFARIERNLGICRQTLVLKITFPFSIDGLMSRLWVA